MAYGNGISAQSTCGASLATPEVVAWIESLGYATERLIGLAAELENRLTSAMSPPAPVETLTRADKAGCQLAGSVQSRVFQLNDIEGSLNAILRRLEL